MLGVLVGSTSRPGQLVANNLGKWLSQRGWCGGRGEGGGERLACSHPCSPFCPYLGKRSLSVIGNDLLGGGAYFLGILKTWSIRKTRPDMVSW